MKKFFKKHGKTILKFVLITAAAITAYIMAHKSATVERGYEAIGGEMFIPMLIIFAKPLWKIIKEPFEVVSKDALD